MAVMWSRHLLFALAAIVAVPTQAEAPEARSNALEQRVLASHNAERARVGMPPLRWNSGLAREARYWAQQLAARGIMAHSRDTGGAGENLWMGTSGAYAPEAMIKLFIDERRYFRPGRFPEVSRTGRWSDVGHYTQLIWPDTRELGCALASGRGNDFLVCRYYPGGNVMGQRVP